MIKVPDSNRLNILTAMDDLCQMLTDSDDLPSTSTVIVQCSLAASPVHG